jgi:hypothetical protein
MRLVAQQTILADGRVLEQVGAAQLAVAAPALFIDRIVIEQPVSPGMMRVMTGAAGHDALADGMCIGLEVICPLLFMAFVADIRLAGGHRNSIDCSMRVVAIGTGGPSCLVGAAGPPQTNIALMAIEAHGILFLDRRPRITPEDDNRRMTRTCFTSSCVRFPGSMTAFALERGEGRIQAGTLSVRSLEDMLHAFIVVAAQTGIRTLRAVIGNMCRSLF